MLTIITARSGSIGKDTFGVLEGKEVLHFASVNQGENLMHKWASEASQ